MFRLSLVMSSRCIMMDIKMYNVVFALYLIELLQYAESLPPPLCSAKRLDKEAQGSCLQTREISPHDVIQVKHLRVMATFHTQRQVSQQ